MSGTSLSAFYGSSHQSPRQPYDANIMMSLLQRKMDITNKKMKSFVPDGSTSEWQNKIGVHADYMSRVYKLHTAQPFGVCRRGLFLWLIRSLPVSARTFSRQWASHACWPQWEAPRLSVTPTGTRESQLTLFFPSFPLPTHPAHQQGLSIFLIFIFSE